MNQRTFYLFLLLVMIVAEISAQNHEVCAVQWKIAGMMPALNGKQKSPGFAGPVAGTHHDVLVIGGGANFPEAMPWLGGKKKYYDDGAVFKWSKKGKAVYYRSFKLPFPLAYSANCSIPQGIVIAGGENDSGISNKVLLLQWNSAKKMVTIQRLPELPLALTNAAITAINNKVYIAGGETKDGVSDLFLTLDVKDTASGWEQLPTLPTPMSHSVMVTQSDGTGNCMYVLGGRKKNNGSISDLYATAFRFDCKTNHWTERKSLPYALSAGTGMAVRSNHILLFGGDQGAAFHKTETLIIAINKETDSVRKQMLNQQKIQVQSTHPGFSRQVLLYNTSKDEWTTVGSIPYDVPVTTTAVAWGMNVVIPSGEIKAGVRTPQILLGNVSCNKIHRKNKP